MASGEPGPVAAGDEVEARVRSVSSGGAGVAELPDGRVVFVHRTVPGERVRLRVTALKRSWGRGELLEVLEASPARREAPCPYYDRCGGCTLEHLVYDEQLAWKGRLVADALERIGGFEDVAPPEVVPSPRQLRYRNRVSFHLRRLGDGRVVAGFHRLERPGRIVDTGADCLLPEEAVARVWADLRAAWGPGASRLPAGRGLRLTLRGVDGGALLLVEPEAGRTEPGRGDAAALVADVEGLRAVWWREGPGREAVLLAGTRDTGESWGDRRIRLGPTTFLQVNREVGRRLHDAVLEEVAEPGVGGTRIVDAYCGVGVWGRRLAREGASVVGIELDPAAVTAARREAPAGFEVVEGRVEDVLDGVLPADTAVLNPPRTGLHSSIPPVLREAGPGRIVYVSCDPPTLARDLERLRGVYRLDGLRAFDLFPQTAHVETVATLTRVVAPGQP